MKLHLNAMLILGLLGFQKSQSQTIDTLIDVGNHKLHFNITKGKGMPILFEAGGGSVSTTWNSILEPLHQITGATLITYDRAGGGKSTIDTAETDIKKHTIINLVEDLETALKKLGYDKEIMLISHSYGGYMTTLYSTRHPELVKSVVLIDVNHKYMDKYGEEDIHTGEQFLSEFKKHRLGLYYQLMNERETTKMISSLSIPLTIPVIDFTSGLSPFKENDKTVYWRKCHADFLDSHPKSIGIMALECGHSIWYQNPSLVITTIAKSYAETKPDKQKIEIYERALNYAINSSNEVKGSVERNLNELGYGYVYKNQNETALEVLKLNTLLFPKSEAAFENYGSLLMEMNKKEEARSMYQKVAELNPGNENAKKALAELSDNRK